MKSTFYPKLALFLSEDIAANIALGGSKSTFSSPLFICIGQPLTLSSHILTPTTRYSVPNLRPPCTKAYAPRFDRLFGVAPVAEQFLESPINLIALRGAKTVASWYQDEDFCKGVANGGLLTAQGGGISPLWEKPIAMPLNATQAQYDALAIRMKEANPDVIIAGSRVRSCSMFVIALKKIDWTPKSLMTSLCVGDPNLEAFLAEGGLKVSDARFLIDATPWDPRLKGPEFQDSALQHFYYNGSGPTSAMQFLSAYVDWSNGTQLDFTSAPLAMAMAYGFEAAYQRALIDSPASVFDAFRTVLVSSFYGKIGFNGYGQDDAKSLANTQRNRTDGIELVSPLSAATASIVYPMPTWTDRIFAPKWFSGASQIAILVIVLIAAAFSIFMAVLTFVFRQAKGIIASSPLFLYLMLLGSLFIYAGILTWPLHTNSAMCMLHWWLLGLGFTMMYGALLVKVWRISRIFNGKDLSLIRITNKELIIFMSVALAIEVVFLIIWSAAGPSLAVRRAQDVNRPRLDYMTCTTPTVGVVMLSLMAAYAAIFIIAGVWLSIKTWKIKYSIYNESRSVAFSMYNLFFFLALAIIAQFVLNSDVGEHRDAQFVVRSAFILLGALLPIAVLFLPKFARKGHLTTDNIGSNSPSQGRSKTSNHTGRTSTNGATLTDDGTGSYEMQDAKAKTQKTIERLEQKNERLKQEVKRLRRELDAKMPSTPKKGDGN